VESNLQPTQEFMKTSHDKCRKEAWYAVYERWLRLEELPQFIESLGKEE
jgi:hypothetical protein